MGEIKKTILDEVCTIQSGAGFPKKYQGLQSGEFPFYKVGDMNLVGNETHMNTANNYISDEIRNSLGAKIFPSGSVIFPKVGGAILTNKKRKINAAGCVDNNVMGLIANDKYLDPDFLYWFMWGTDIYEMSNKANPPSITQSTVKNWPINAPPIPEQKRIVAILDEAFAGIDQAIANTEKNLASARELFESTSRSLISNTQDVTKITLLEMIEKGWIISHLDGNHGGDYPRKHEFIEEGVPYISANSLKKGEVDFEKAKYLSPERAATLRKGIAQDRDVLFAHNATVGPVALLKTSEDKVILGTSLTYYRCDENKIIPEYLVHFLKSPEFTKQYKLVMRQSTRNQVPITKQREFYHCIPPLDKQRKIAESLDNLSEVVKSLENKYHQKLFVLNELKQSLLQKAFSGELTADMADEAKAEAAA